MMISQLIQRKRAEAHFNVLEMMFVFLLLLQIPDCLTAQDSLGTDVQTVALPVALRRSVSMELKDVSLREALSDLSSKGGFFLNYSENILPEGVNVSLKLEDIPAVDALLAILDGTEITFIVSESEQIILIEKVEKSHSSGSRGSINGYVRDAATGEALIGSNIMVSSLGLGCTSNRYGFYSLTLPIGFYTVRFQYIGYESRTVDIQLTDDVRQDVELIMDVIQGETVTVRARSVGMDITSTEMGTSRFVPEEVEYVPVLMGEHDIFRTIQLLPGVAQVREGDAGFTVRGGRSDQNLVLLDEAPIHNAFHMLGTFSVFNTDAIQNVTLIKGSAPPRYGGKCSSVLDIQMKEGNLKKLQAEGAVGSIFSRFNIQGPIIKDVASFMVSGRRTYADLFTLFAKDENVRNSTLHFFDFNLKMNYFLSDKDRLFISGYFGRDAMGLDEGEDDVNVSIGWGNQTGTLRWNRVFSQRLFSNTSLVYNHFNYRMIIDEEDEAIDIYSSIGDVTLKEDIQFFLEPGNTLHFGVHGMYHTYHPGRFRHTGDEEDFQIVVGDREAYEAAVYISHEWDVFDVLKLDYGVRFTLFHALGKRDYFDIDEIKNIPAEFVYLDLHDNEQADYTSFEPRISARLSTGNSSSVKAGYARNMQNVHLLSGSTTGTPFNVWVPSSRTVKPQRVDQYALGFFQNFKDHVYETSVELFYKDLRNQSDFRDNADIIFSSFFESELVFGKGRAYGAEFLLKKRTGRFTGWIAYTLSRSETMIDEINGGKPYPTGYDRTHDVSVVGVFKLGNRTTLSMNWSYSSGMPITVPTGKYWMKGRIVHAYSDRNAYRLPAYHRLDISLTLETKKGEKWNFSLYNAYGRRNTYSVFYQKYQPNEIAPVRTQAVRLALFSFMPSISYAFTF